MEPVFIIAEAGINHNGSLKVALKMIEVAADAGANAIKFQTFLADKLVSKHAQKASYQKRTSIGDESQQEMLRKLELSRDDHIILMNHADKNNIQFLSTPFDMDSIDLLVDLGLKTFKIPSGEITNLPYLQRVGRLKNKIILSTGMANLDEISKAIDILTSEGTTKDKIIVLHSTTEYPAPFEEVNLMAMVTIEKTFGVKIGYSDHTKGFEVAIAAVALGAKAIEKHFTLNRTMEGPDQKSSLQPSELKNMVDAIRHIEKALGDGIKKPTPSELENMNIVRKSIHYAKNLKKGCILEAGDIIMKRPGDGISPMELNNIITRTLSKDVCADTQIRWEDLI